MIKYDTETDDGEEIEFECEAKTEEAESEFKDKIKFKVSVDDGGLKVEVKYEQEIETSTSESETETEYEVLFDRIVEYKKSESSGVDGAFDWAEDIVVSELLLTEFAPFSEVGNYDGTNFVFAITTVDGLATFTFTISQGGPNEAITANKMKIDFSLDGYGWVRDDTYVALLCSVESEREVEIEYEDGDKEKTEDVKISFDDATEGTGIRPFGEFTWAKDALVLSMIDETTAPSGGETAVELMDAESSVTIQVIATSPDDDTDRVAFSFVGDAAMAAETIYWDPEAGVGYSDGTSGAVSLLLSLTGTLAALSLLVLW